MLLELIERLLQIAAGEVLRELVERLRGLRGAGFLLLLRGFGEFLRGFLGLLGGGLGLLARRGIGVFLGRVAGLGGASLSFCNASTRASFASCSPRRVMVSEA